MRLKYSMYGDKLFEGIFDNFEYFLSDMLKT